MFVNILFEPYAYVIVITSNIATAAVVNGMMMTVNV